MGVCRFTKHTKCRKMKLIGSGKLVSADHRTKSKDFVCSLNKCEQRKCEEKTCHNNVNWNHTVMKKEKIMMCIALISYMTALTTWIIILFISSAEAFQVWHIPASTSDSNLWSSFLVNNPHHEPKEAATTAPVLTDHAPSWDDLRAQILNTPTGSRLQHEECLQRKQGLGPPHTDAKVRLFSETNENAIRVTFYRDQAAWCPYCQKVWLFLEQKQIPYKVEKVPLNAYGDKPVWYSRKVDGGKLPAIEMDGILYTESMDIMTLLEDAFPTHTSMIPIKIGSQERQALDELLDLEQELQRAWFSLVFYPVKDDALIKANQTLLETLEKMNRALGDSDGPWFLGGTDPSLVDILFIPMVERMIPSVLYWKGFHLMLATAELTYFHKWLSAWEKQPQYLASRSDYYTHIMAIPSQNGPGYMIPAAKVIANQLSGLSGAWTLPLNLNNNTLTFFPDRNPNNESYTPRHEAAYKVIENHERIIKFACRGAGEPGRPSFHAQLADPYAEPNEEYVPAMDICLRHVVHAMIHTSVDASTEAERLAKRDLLGKAGNDRLRESWTAHLDDDDPSLVYYWNDETGETTWTPPTQQLDTCLTYLRDRVGVPRDMGPAAAMELRAHLNWAIDLMKG